MLLSVVSLKNYEVKKQIESKSVAMLKIWALNNIRKVNEGAFITDEEGTVLWVISGRGEGKCPKCRECRNNGMVVEFHQ